MNLHCLVCLIVALINPGAKAIVTFLYWDLTL